MCCSFLSFFLSVFVCCQNNQAAFWPVTNAKITSPFGQRLDPFLHVPRFHTGVDLGAALGSAVKAVAAGQVVFSGEYAGYGNVVVVRHNNDVTTHYAHCWGVKVHVGQKVKKGQTLGFLGETGRVTGPNLHFEVRWRGAPVNPAWLFQE